VVEFGPNMSKKTSSIDNGGSEGFWPHLNYKCDVSIDNLFEHKLSVKVYDENTLNSDAIIGAGTISLKSLAAEGAFETVKELMIHLLGPKNKPSGRLMIKCVMMKKEILKELKVKEGFVKGVLHVTKIIGHEINSGGLFGISIGELSTYIVLKVIDPATAVGLNPSQTDPKVWTGKTPIKTGHVPHWDLLDLRPPVTVDSLKGCMTIECWGKTLGGLGGDKLLGTGEISLLPAGARAGEEVVLNVDLFPSSALQGPGKQDPKGGPASSKGASVEPVGKLFLYVTVRDLKDIVTPVVVPPIDLKGKDRVETIQKVEEDFVQKDFTTGMLFISYARGSNLSTSDTYLVFQFGVWEALTTTLKGVSGEIIWKDMDMSTLVTGEALRKEYLKVTVWNESSIRGNVMVGSGQVLLKRNSSRIGVELEVVIRLSDANNKDAGKIILKTQVDIDLSFYLNFFRSLTDHALFIHMHLYVYVYDSIHWYICMNIYISCICSVYECVSLRIYMRTHKSYICIYNHDYRSGRYWQEM
jgi:hypothetical protein